MARYIDAELLLTDNTYEWFDDWGNYTSAGQAIVDAPTADVVEVIRCKDCMYYEDICGYDCFHPKQEHGCNSEGGECLNMNPDDFCSYGKKVE